ncbi:DUF2326 domain-containing protein [Lactococcus garvieae]|uniref:DUF2326 domain-containing protein n=1 Tax=Lactococcus garvieae TaxID=1363 RepID=UPI0022DEAD07|nr:DUF2326 domain-containing protein [Lactococcus garvieae]
MYIKTLKIKNTVDDILVRPAIEFHEGVNLIIDSQNGEKHNKVGKTTLLRLVDIVLGAKDKKALYKDKDTGAEDPTLKEFIENNKVSATLLLVDNLNKANVKIEVGVDLYEGGRRYFNGEIISQEKLRLKLNEVLFDNISNIPTFRQAIGAFVRISMNGDNNTFLRVIDRGRTSDYRALYNFLFDISDPLEDKQHGKRKKELDTLIAAEKKYLEVNGENLSVAQLEQIIDGFSKEIERLKAQLDDLISAKEFEENRSKISKVRSEYEALTSKLSALSFQIERSEVAIQESIKQSKNKIDDSLAREFFVEIKGLIPSVAKTYEELVDFNNRLLENKVRYFQTTKEKLEERYKLIQEKKEKLVSENASFISIVENNKVDEYYNLTNLINERKNEKAKKEENLSTLLKFAKRKEKLESELSGSGRDDFEKSKKNYIKKMRKFNSFFTAVASEINGERPQLVYEPNIDKFPVSISEMNQGTSTGTTKSLIASYDIAYQLFAESEKKVVPNFILHDVLETVEGKNLKATFSQVNKTNSQYIVAVLSEKLDSSGISDKDKEVMKVIELSEKHKLFEGYID